MTLTKQRIVGELSKLEQLYAQMLQLVKKTNQALGENESELLSTLMDKRKSLTERIQEKHTDVQKLLESPEADAVIILPAVTESFERVEELMQTVADESAKGTEIVQAAMNGLRDTLDTMNRGRKSVAGYGQERKKTFARYFDRKL